MENLCRIVVHETLAGRPIAAGIAVAAPLEWIVAADASWHDDADIADRVRRVCRGQGQLNTTPTGIHVDDVSSGL